MKRSTFRRLYLVSARLIGYGAASVAIGLAVAAVLTTCVKTADTYHIASLTRDLKK